MRLFAKRTEPPEGNRGWTFLRWCDITIDGELYLSRLNLLKTPWFSIKLHWIHKPDPDRDLHDHPWWFVSFVLRGGYTEITCADPAIYPRIEHKVSWFNSKNCKEAHRIAYVKPKTLTLVITGGKKKSWGFFDDHGRFTDWKQYARKM
jgi:hypothetical protein